MATRSPHAVGTPITFSRACARASARLHSVEICAHIVPRQVQHLAAEPPIFLICASVSADPRASLPWALQAAAIRRTAALNFGARGQSEPPSCALKSECPYAIMSIPSTAAISSTFSRPSSDLIDGNRMMFSLAHGAYSVAWRAP